MKRTLFIMTHVGSGWESLASALEKNQRYQCFSTSNSYRHPDDIRSLTDLPHRFGGAAAVWCDTMLHNKDFCMKHLCRYYNFIFWSGPKDRAMKALIELGYGVSQASDYYDLRITGMRIYHSRCPSPWNPSLNGDSFLGPIL
jgi:hypothetical protein